MGTITSLKVQKGDNDRVSVFLDGEYAFSVSLLAAAALKKGQVLTAAEIARLQAEGAAHLAYQQAVRYLGFRPRSKAEIESYLREKGAPLEVIGEVVERLVNRGYLDDAEFARFWVEDRTRFRPRGRRALRYELHQKGVAREDIDAALDGLAEDAAAWEAVSNKLERWRGLDEREFQQKVMAFLSRRGFDYDTCREAADRAWEHVTSDASEQDD
jgi:regulatory protein